MSIYNARKIISNLVTGDNNIKVSVLDTETFKDGSTRIIADVYKSDSTTEDEIYASVEAKLKNKMRCVSSTFAVLDSNKYADRITGILTPKTESVALTEDNKEEFTSLAGNMYIDEDQDVWTLKQTESGDLLIKTSYFDDVEAVQELMDSVSSDTPSKLSPETQAGFASFCSMITEVQGGDFVDFYNPDSKEVTFGVVLASVEEESEGDTGKLLALASNGKNYVELDRSMIVNNHGALDFPEPEDSIYKSVSGAISLEMFLDYYRKVFIRNPDFFARFEKLARERLS